ncbi:hypothetical protein [Polaribacter sp.]|uniref:hypothetical protein n=1 Tax=Polaribacter sp. TaxID=1920175 RepID=UPI003EF6CE88
MILDSIAMILKTIAMILDSIAMISKKYCNDFITRRYQYNTQKSDNSYYNTIIYQHQ